MKLSFVFLCLSLATLSPASIPSVEEERPSLSRKRHLESSQPSGKRVKKDVSRTTGQSSRVAKKKLVESGKPVPKKRQKKRVAVIKGVKTSVGAGEESSAVVDSGKSNQKSAYLDGSYSVILERNWSAADNEDGVAVDSERHYLITEQDIQASSHGNSEQVNLGDPDLSLYDDFESSHDGRFLFFTGSIKKQAEDDSSDEMAEDDSSDEMAEDDSSDEIAARWLVQDTSTKSLKNVVLESSETFTNYYSFELSANGKTLLSTHCALNTWTTSVYQIKEHWEAASASKKGDFEGHAHAVSGNGNRILVKLENKKQLEIHDISGDGCNLVLEINYTGATAVGSFAMNNDGSKAAFINYYCKLYIVDVGKEKNSISLDQLTAIDLPGSVETYNLRYDAKDRLYALIDGSLWLVDPSKRELVSLEKAEVPQGYEIQSEAISSNRDYIALLFRSADENEKGEYQYQMIVKRNEEVTKKALLRFCSVT